MRGSWLIFAALAINLLSAGCARDRAVARKERLPATSLPRDLSAQPTDSVASVLRPDEGGDPRSMRTPAIDGQVQYASLVEDVEGVPNLPPAVPAAGAPPMQIAQAPPRGVPDSPTAQDRDAERIRRIARRLQESAPERLEEFLREVRQAALQGNAQEMLSSWEVAAEFVRANGPVGASPVSSRSLSAALDTAPVMPARPAPQSTNDGAMPTDRGTPAAARMTEVAGTAERVPPATASTSAPPLSDGRRRLSYSPAEEESAEPAPRTTSPEGMDFVSWAERMQEQSRRDAGDPTRWAVYGRLVHAMAGQTEQALDPIDGLDPADRRFWRGYVYALDRYFADRSGARPQERAADAVVALRDSIDALAEKADLSITEPIFCRAVHSYGNYEEFDRYDFRSTEGVVVYWETRNFSSVESAEGYRTRMQAEFEILDSLGNRRHRFEQKFKDDVCRTRRHDYFNVVVFEWPRDLTPGDYVMKVTVTDLASQKVAEKQRKFRIVP